ncbi:hypothetical protein GGI22_007649 [Coemansia erecta]|nr:hypothetical protein GGI22_007649 [Coemansia erecta]
MAAAGAAFSAAMGTPINGTSGVSASQPRSPDDEFPAIASPVDDEMEEDDGADQRKPTGTYRTTQTTERTPNVAARKASVRTPADIRSVRQPRTCTRPGCAAHTPHSHEDGKEAPVMQLKPPVPRFRRRGLDANEAEDAASAAASTLPTRSRQSSAAASAASAAASSTRHAPYLRNPAASSTAATRSLVRSASSSGETDQNSRRGTSAADIFR